MAEKFFDIIPPEKAEKVMLPKPEEGGSLEEKEYFYRAKSHKSFFFRGLLILVGVIAIVAGAGFLLFYSSKAEIKIWPQKSQIGPQKEILLGVNYFEDERSVKNDFLATGIAQVTKKATGTVVVYNEYSTSSRTLVPSRFVSADGKLFRSVEKITIPGARYEKGKLVPGEKEVKVEATEPGESYNIGPTTFALPALAGSPLYTTIYAKSFNPMTGGYIGQTAQVSSEDLKAAEESLLKEAKELAKNDFKNSLGQESIILEETISQEVLEKNSSQKAGDQVDSFNLEIEVRSKLFAFSKSDLEGAIQQLIQDNLKENEKFREDKTEISYNLKSTDLDNKKITLNLKIKTEVYKDIKTEELQKALLGKSLKEAEMLLASFSEISKFELKLQPFFRKSLPQDAKRVKVELVLD